MHLHHEVQSVRFQKVGKSGKIVRLTIWSWRLAEGLREQVLIVSRTRSLILDGWC